jgi:predicted metal-dependent hydrolase
MKPNEETPIDETTLKVVLNDQVQELKEINNFIKKQQSQIDQKDKLLSDKEKQTQTLLNNFETKFKSITVQAPKPDLSEVNATLDKGLSNINQTIEKGPKPITRQLRLLFFPEQLRSVEYVKAVLTRVIWCILTLVFMVLAFELLKMYVK